MFFFAYWLTWLFSPYCFLISCENDLTAVAAQCLCVRNFKSEWWGKCRMHAENTNWFGRKNLETIDFGPLMIAPPLTKCNSHSFLVYYHFLVQLVAQWNGIYRQQTGKKQHKKRARARVGWIGLHGKQCKITPKVAHLILFGRCF